MPDASNDETEWTTYGSTTHKRDPSIDGHEIKIEGWHASFFVTDHQLTHINLTLEKYIDWLLTVYPPSEPPPKS